jgi:hypothetical protein
MCDFEKANDSIPRATDAKRRFSAREGTEEPCFGSAAFLRAVLLLAPCGCFLTVSIVVRRVV